MVYNVIGLMSGSSLAGLDIAYVSLEEIRGEWKFAIIRAECVPYTEDMVAELSKADHLDVSQFLRLHTRYGRFIGEQVRDFMNEHDLAHKVHFIASHGHTVFHDPAQHTSVQIGDGATIAAVAGVPVISDLRSMDVALGGQGAPIVPIGDKLLFGEYDYWLNIGGIANMTVRKGEKMLAFDICPANQVLNILAAQEGQPFDKDGMLARRGRLLIDVLSQLNGQEFYSRQAPKSLSNEAAISLAFPYLLESKQENLDRLRTAVQHIAEQVATTVRAFPQEKQDAKMLVTGGGAFNTFLVEQIRDLLKPLNVQVVVPDHTVVKYKEALVMALIGALRWREEKNVLSTVTGASRDSIGGALWMVD